MGVFMRSKKDQKLYDKTREYLEKIGDSNIEERMKVVEKDKKRHLYKRLLSQLCKEC